MAADPAIPTLFEAAELGDEPGAAPPGAEAMDGGEAVDPVGAPAGGAGGEDRGDSEGEAVVGAGVETPEGDGVGACLGTEPMGAAFGATVGEAAGA
ncbi:Hypothetical predicted protein [Olea europaea subsp. europaea]|uniref:Uncharacterized protein n=1 Tax=Olea europaea subsp. europaea TaxID=158383 RepID=A0A8S0VCT4_OLEEU|nr:Hypothetical predicted protein [Olea europaea subsp. europaea]